MLESPGPFQPFIIQCIIDWLLLLNKTFVSADNFSSYEQIVMVSQKEQKGRAGRIKERNRHRERRKKRPTEIIQQQISLSSLEKLS